MTVFADVFFTKFQDTLSLGITFLSSEKSRSPQQIPEVSVNGRPLIAIKSERMPTSYERWRYTYVKTDTLAFFEEKKSFVELFDSTAVYQTTLKYRY